MTVPWNTLICNYIKVSPTENIISTLLTSYFYIVIFLVPISIICIAPSANWISFTTIYSCRLRLPARIEPKSIRLSNIKEVYFISIITSKPISSPSRSINKAKIII